MPGAIRLPKPKHEATIRDSLADNLELLEDGLTLIEVEYHLPNSFGASGFVDIVARDRYGHFAVVEVKRSDSSARQAVHEFQKYVSLLRSELGIPAHQLRCALVSTHWHELLVPFSEFAAMSPYPVAGFDLTLDGVGLPIKAESVEPIVTRNGSRISPYHLSFLFQSTERRDATLPTLEAVLARVGLLHYGVVVLDYEGSNRAVRYPFAQYLVIPEIDLLTRQAIEHASGSLETELECLVQDEELVPGDLEQAVLTRIVEQYIDGPDTLEVGHPDKFRSIIRTWSARSIVRRGRLFPPERLLPDDQLISSLMGLAGSSVTQFYATATPKLRPGWDNMRASLHEFLSENPGWQGAIDWFLTLIEAEQPESSVGVFAYYPLNTLTSLIGYAASGGDEGWLPSLEILVEDSTGKALSVLRGTVEWDQTWQPTSASQTVDQIFGDSWSFVFASGTRDTEDNERKVMEAHGPSYAVFESILTTPADPPSIPILRIAQRQGEFVAEPWNGLLNTITVFGASQAAYIADLRSHYNKGTFPGL